jgi:Asp-tRNA(Asn)/Glu-tRNA(Gln) amidotransferase A subunit family amidase
MCPAALGTQTAGSVLRPAAYCGVVGTKPTYGRISRYGVFPLCYTLDHVGFLTRTVEDGAILLGVLAGSDPQDPTTSLEAVPDYGRSCKSLRRPPHIGIIREYYQEKSEEQVWRHTEKVLMQLKRAGAPLEEVKMPPSFAAVQDAHRVIMRVEGASFHQKLMEKHPDLYRPKLRELVAIGLLIPSVDYLRAQKIKRQFRDQMDQVIKNYDCLLTPSVSAPAPLGLSSTGDPHFQVPWSLSGLPAISLPTGLSSQGLPLGIQLVGAAFAEGRLFAAARWCEEVLRVSLIPPLG